MGFARYCVCAVVALGCGDEIAESTSHSTSDRPTVPSNGGEAHGTSRSGDTPPSSTGAGGATAPSVDAGSGGRTSGTHGGASSDAMPAGVPASGDTSTSAGGASPNEPLDGAPANGGRGERAPSINAQGGRAIAPTGVDGSATGDADGVDADNEKSPIAPGAAASCFPEATPASSAELALEVSASRVSGVAPLAVFFDAASATSARAAERPFHELAYCWDFGDPTSGQFATSGLSRNHAKGPVAAHVFERPGTYTVTVNARDPEGRVATRTIAIEVADPDRVFAGEATACLSSSGTFDGCPEGARRITGSDLGAAREYAASGRRLLLRRGDAFRGSLAINSPGPGSIGAYGDGNRPRIDASSVVFRISGQSPRFSDHRIVDLEIVGQGADSGAVDVGGMARDLLLLRLKTTGTGHAVIAPESIIQYWRNQGSTDQDLSDGFFVQDCEMGHVSGVKTLLFVAAHRLAMLGNVYEDSGEHVLRVPWTERAVISSNYLSGAIPTKHVVKLHGPGWASSGIARGRYTERVVLSDNVFQGGDDDWTVSVGPQNAQSDERVRDLIVERNLFLPSERVQVPLTLSGNDLTVRDNVFFRCARPQTSCMSVGARGIEPPPARVSILHNTCASLAESPRLAQISGSATDVRLFNNLVAGASAGSTGATNGSREGGNLITTAPGFVVTSPSGAWKDFRLGASSPAIDAADVEAATPWDFTGRLRPVDGDGSSTAEPDAGAFEFSPTE